MKNNFSAPYAKYRNTDPQRFWKEVCGAVSTELQTFRSNKREMCVAKCILADLIYKAYKKGQPFPLHASYPITPDESDLMIEKHHFAFSGDDLETPSKFAYTAYIPLENDSIYPCMITDDMWGNLYFDIFSPHCVADYCERVFQMPFSPSKNPKRKKEEQINSRVHGINWMRHFMFFNQHSYTDEIADALSKEQQKSENQSLVTVWNEGITYSQPFNYPFIVLHTSFLPFVRNGQKCRLDEDQLRSVQPFLEKVRQMDKEQTFVLI